MRNIYRLEAINTNHEPEYICDYPTLAQAEKARDAILNSAEILSVSITETKTPKPSGYNVILIYKDGSQFECAESVTLARAKRIEKETLEAKANIEFAFRDVAEVRIVKGGNDE